MKDWRKMLEGIGGYDNEMIGVPSGGVKEMVDDIESLKQQLAEREKQIVMLRGTVEEVSNILADNQLWAACALCNTAITATQDLPDLVLCYSTSVGDVTRYGKDSEGRMWHGINWYDQNVSVPQGTKLYIAMR